MTAEHWFTSLATDPGDALREAFADMRRLTVGNVVLISASVENKRDDGQRWVVSLRASITAPRERTP